ncbi:MAG: c-type cytochrome [Pirellulaceae bacterium]
MQNLYICALLACLTAAVFVDHCGGAEPGDSPEGAAKFPDAMSPRDSLAAIRVTAGLRVELIAAEPLVADPIDVAFGPDGRVWVVEMGDYPLGVDGNAGGRVRFLTDSNGDGNLDQSTLFLDGLNFPTSVAPWRDGVLVTAAPDLLFARDTDGDGRADTTRVLYTGFGEGNQQHRVNGLQWGLDNWIHVANGDSNGVIVSKKTGQKVDISGRDLRIRPDSGELDPLSARTQYGRHRDDWGNWFGCSNSRPAWHVALADHYLRRNRHFVPPDPAVHISETPGAARIYPASKTLARFNDAARADRFTSACGHMIYRDERLGAQFAGNSFVCEPVHNLVHREIVEADGATFHSHRPAADAEREFFASADNWTRPTNIRLAPDGSLWVVDMYRLVIEHPQWIPEAWQAKVDLRAGADMGRIYRISRAGDDHEEKFAMPRLDRLSTDDLVRALNSPNGWRRDMVQQLLLWRAEEKAGPPLAKLAADGRRPQTRLQALCTLDGLDAITVEVLLDALKDPHPGVRRHAIRLSETWRERFPQLTSAALQLVDDPDPQVQMQLAYSLGEWSGAAASAALAKLLMRHENDPYRFAAAVSSLDERKIGPVLDIVLSESRQRSTHQIALLQVVRLALLMGDDDVVRRTVDAMTQRADGKLAEWQLQALADMRESLTTIRKKLDADAQTRLQQVFQQARAVANDDSATETDRLTAIPLLAVEAEHRNDDLNLLSELLLPQNAPVLQQAALESLAQVNSARPAELLLEHFAAATPRLRAQIVDVLLSRNAWIERLLASLADGRIQSRQLSASHRQLLVTHRNRTVRERAEELLADTLSADRQAIVASYRDALRESGDMERGRKVFRKNCNVCHRLENDGHQVGPDLAGLKNPTPEAMLVAILDPNQAVEDRYLQYTAVTVRGRIFSGMLAAETGASITLAGPEGKRHDILRGDIEQLTSSGKSLMPDGMEKQLTPQDLSDLFAYLADNQNERER